MSRQVQELIDKIKTEGLQAADEKSKEIESQAQKKAQKIVEAAQRQAREMVEEAKQEIQKRQDASRMALQHAARDTLLALHKEIRNILQEIVVQHVSETLTPALLSKIIIEISQKAIEKNLADTAIEVTLNEQDLKKLRESFLAHLQKEIKKSIELKSADDIGKGLTISFDEGKSCFDVTASSLAEYLSTYLNEYVAGILKKTVKTEKL